MITRSPGFGGANRLFDRQTAIRIHEQRRGRTLRCAGIHRRHDAELDFFDDAKRILGPRVVRGQDDQIAQSRRHGTHQRPLRAIAIAAAAEDRDQTALRQRPRRLEQVLQRIVGVRVVDDDAHVVGRGRHHLESAGDAVESGDAGLQWRPRARPRPIPVATTPRML